MRRTLFKWHSTAALLAMLPLMVIAITGSILVFKVEIDTWLMPEHMAVSVADNQPRKNINTLMETVKAANPQYVLGSWELFDDKSRSDAVYLIHKQSAEWYKLYLNQYSGELLSQPVSVTHDVTDWLLSLHYTFLLGVAGTTVGFLFALLLFFLAVSGMVLHRHFWKKLVTLRFHAAKRVLLSDIHKLIGIFSSPVLLVLAVTGAYWNASEVLHELTEHGEGYAYTNVALYNPKLDFQALINKTASHVPGHRPTYLTFPFEEARHISVFGDVPNKNILSSEYSSVVTYDRQTGDLMSAIDVRTSSGWSVIVDMFRKLHFGYFAGVPSKIIWCVLGLSPLWLALTGLYFYLFRVKRKRSQKAIYA